MAFAQIIDLRTSQIDQMRAVADEWEKASEGKRKTRRRLICRDRDDGGRYLIVAFFDSYEEAMENSALAETDAFSKKMLSFADGAPTFVNLEVIEDKEG